MIISVLLTNNTFISSDTIEFIVIHGKILVKIYPVSKNISEWLNPLKFVEYELVPYENIIKIVVYSENNLDDINKIMEPLHMPEIKTKALFATGR